VPAIFCSYISSLRQKEEKDKGQWNGMGEEVVSSEGATAALP